MNFLTDKPTESLFQFLSNRIGLNRTSDFVGLGRVVDDKLVGVLGFNNFNGASVQMHMAGDPGWLTRGMLETAARYVFETLGLQMILALVPSGNVKALEMDKRMGFVELIAVPGAHPDGALHMLCMRKHQCRWLRRKQYGQENHSHAA
jgi:RimJ/RimL family protein N-acetyltransferase